MPNTSAIQAIGSSTTTLNNIGLKTVWVNDKFTTTGPIANGWTDLAGSTWNVNSAGVLTGSTADGAGYLTKFCLRPLVEATLNQEEYIDLQAGINTQASLGVVLRHQAGSNNHYLAKLNPGGGLEVFKIVGGSVVNIHFGTNYGVNGFVYDNSHRYSLQFACHGSSSTTLRVKIYDHTSGDTVLELIAQDNEPSLQIIGRSGKSVWNNGFASVNVTNSVVSDLGPTSGMINVIYFGDSITKGEGTTLTGYYNTLNGYPYPAVCAREIGQHMTGVNLGIGGRRLDEMLTDAATSLPNNIKSGYKNVVVLHGGANDIIQLNGSTTDIYNRIKNFGLLAKSLGCKFIATTILPASQISADRFNYIRNEVNTLIRANHSDFSDGLCDFASDGTIGFDGAEKDPRYFNPDQIHPANEGARIMGRMMGQTIKAVFSSGKIVNGNIKEVIISTVKQAIIDFGNNLLGETDLTVSISDSQVIATNKVQLGSIMAGSGRDPDEMELETITANLGTIYTGGFDIYVKNPTQGATGQYLINYTIN